VPGAEIVSPQAFLVVDRATATKIPPYVSSLSLFSVGLIIRKVKQKNTGHGQAWAGLARPTRLSLDLREELAGTRGLGAAEAGSGEFSGAGMISLRGFWLSIYNRGVSRFPAAVHCSWGAVVVGDNTGYG
jgi:hypothetical protein